MKKYDDLNLSQLSTMHLLIADDDESALFYLNEILKKSCNNIIKVKSGKEAVEVCKNNDEVSLVLMDIKMPEMDGIEATKAIKKIKPEIKIIGQTAYALVGDKQKVMDAGCDDYITKPINRRLLMKMIAKHI